VTTCDLVSPSDAAFDGTDVNVARMARMRSLRVRPVVMVATGGYKALERRAFSRDRVFA
jgi:hypothetical protein